MHPVCATILVLVITNHNLILAADSRRTKIYPDGTKERDTMDKIYQTNDWYYAVSGFNATEDGRFNIQTVLHAILMKHEDVVQTLRVIATTLTGALKNYFTDLKKSSPDFFARLIAYNNSGGEVVLVKRIHTIPTACLLEYQIRNEASLHVVTNTWYITTKKIQTPESCFWRAIGNTSFLHFQMPSENEMAQHPVENIKRIVEEGIRRFPDFVSHPINMLELTEEGERWIEKSRTAPNHIDHSNQ